MKTRTGKLAKEEILQYLAQHGTVDKDAAIAIPTNAGKKNSIVHVSKRQLRRDVDLHGLTSDRATMAIRRTIQECRSSGIKQILFIHGIGLHSGPAEEPVLKNLVRTMLERELAPVVRNYKTADPKDGGDGATVAWLR
jgi:DNA-nicking Smr family endonuclease